VTPPDGTEALTLRPIGVIHTPHRQAEGTPIQPAFARDAEGRVVLDAALAPALADLDGFDRVWLVFWLHRAAPHRLTVTPYRDRSERGLFSTRAPCRPNPIGISAVRLLAVEGNVLRVSGVDMLDGTPLLDVKPYAPRFDAYPDARAGWLDRSATRREVADDRFHGRSKHG